MKKKLFIEKMELLQRYYNYELKKDILELYWQRLEKIEDKEFNKIVNQILDSEFQPGYKKPFPLIKDFVELTLAHFAKENGADYLLRKY